MVTVTTASEEPCENSRELSLNVTLLKVSCQGHYTEYSCFFLEDFRVRWEMQCLGVTSVCAARFSSNQGDVCEPGGRGLAAVVGEGCQWGPAAPRSCAGLSLSLCSAPHNNIFIWDCCGTGELHLLIKFGWITLWSRILKCGDVPGICKRRATLLIDWFCLSQNKITGSVNALCPSPSSPQSKVRASWGWRTLGMMGTQAFRRGRRSPHTSLCVVS